MDLTDLKELDNDVRNTHAGRWMQRDLSYFVADPYDMLDKIYAELVSDKDAIAFQKAVIALYQAELERELGESE